MAWVAIDDFNSATSGDLNGTGGGSGWSGNWSGNTNYDYTGTNTYEGAGAAVNSTNANADIERVLTTASTSGTVYFAMRAGSNGAGLVATKFRNSAGNGRFGVIMNSSGNIILEGSSNQTILAGYSTNTWYVFYVTYDTTTDTAVAAYSTGTYGSAGTWSAETANAGMQNSGTGGIERVLVSKDARAGTDIWDYISPTTPFAAAGPANLKSLDGNLKANMKSFDGNVLANIKSISGNS